jgi:hypothetical protein
MAEGSENLEVALLETRPFGLDQPPTLLNLPAEIRLEVYKIIRPSIRVWAEFLPAYAPWEASPSQTLGLLLTCRQLYCEYLPVLYSRLRVECLLRASRQISKHKPDWLRLVKHIEIDIRGPSFPRNYYSEGPLSLPKLPLYVHGSGRKKSVRWHWDVLNNPYGSEELGILRYLATQLREPNGISLTSVTLTCGHYWMAREKDFPDGSYFSALPLDLAVYLARNSSTLHCALKRMCGLEQVVVADMPSINRNYPKWAVKYPFYRHCEEKIQRLITKMTRPVEVAIREDRHIQRAREKRWIERQLRARKAKLRKALKRRGVKE